jgi:hypothetical protein
MTTPDLWCSDARSADDTEGSARCCSRAMSRCARRGWTIHPSECSSGTPTRQEEHEQHRDGNPINHNNTRRLPSLIEDPFHMHLFVGRGPLIPNCVPLQSNDHHRSPSRQRSCLLRVRRNYHVEQVRILYCVDPITGGERIANQLCGRVPGNDISGAVSDKTGTRLAAHEQHTKAPEGMTGAGTGGVLGGGLAGWLESVRSRPGIGPFIGQVRSCGSGRCSVGAAAGVTGALLVWDPRVRGAPIGATACCRASSPRCIVRPPRDSIYAATPRPSSMGR